VYRLRVNAHRLTLLGVCCLALGACKGGSGAVDAAVDPDAMGSSPDAPIIVGPKRDGSTSVDVAPLPAGSALIGAQGGSLASEDGRVTLQIPREALLELTVVSIKQVASAPGGVQGPAYQLGPDGTKLMKAATVTFTPEATDVTGVDLGITRLGLYTVGGQWVELDNRVASTATGTVKGTTTVLGMVGLLAGLCTSCPPPCNPATCRFGEVMGMPGSGVPGLCRKFGNGCTACVPACDADGDGYCPPGAGDGQPEGDCDDGNPLVHPDAKEICGNTVDENCNGHQDEGCRSCTRHGDCPIVGEACISGVCQLCDSNCDPTMCKFDIAPGMTVDGRCVAFGRGCARCVPPCDMDGDGFCPGKRTDNMPDGDCNDNDPSVSPEGTEVCGNGVDDDCDGKVDEVCTACGKDADCPDQQRCAGGLCAACPAACNPATCRFGGMAGMPETATPGRCMPQGNGCSVCVPSCDSDGDGYCPGSPPNDQPGNDCNDGDPRIHPEAVEICGNHLDDDCNDHVDEGCQACTDDADCTTGSEACVGGFCALCSTCDPTDCKFGDMPGRCAPQGKGCTHCVPGCDKDGDGFCPGDPGANIPGGDCNDDDRNVNPQAREVCGNGVDDDCNGLVDDGCTICQSAVMCGVRQSCSSGK
jgi:hypothetical protein